MEGSWEGGGVHGRSPGLPDYMSWLGDIQTLLAIFTMGTEIYILGSCFRLTATLYGHDQVK